MAWTEIKNKNEGRTATSLEENHGLLKGTRCPGWVEGFWLKGAMSVLSAETPTSTWMPFPPPSSLTTASDLRRVDSETKPWPGLPLCSWPCAEARTDWARESSFPTAEQILPLIRNGHGREDLSQSATGLDIANNFSLWFLEDLCQGFLQLHTATMICLCFWKNGQQ